MQPLKICTELISLKIEAVWVLILLKDSYLGPPILVQLGRHAVMHLISGIGLP